MTVKNPEEWMGEALSLAEEAARQGEIPVGCVIVDGEGRALGFGRNRRQEKRDATAHAEVEAIRMACAARGDWRLEDCTLFVTLEPCPMCAGAILNARLKSVVYGAREPKSGSLGSVIDLYSEAYGYHPKVYGGLRREACAELMEAFFAELRE